MKISVFGKAKFKKVPAVFLILAACLVLLAAIFLVTNPSAKITIAIEDEIPQRLFEQDNYQKFEDYAKEVGAKKAYEVLKSHFSKNEPQAHDFAHVVGNAAVEEFGIDGIKICDNFYNYGCFHGFMQVYLTKHGVASVKNMEKVCNNLGEVHAPSCLHGTGHGLMMEAYYDLSEALDNCQILENSSRTYCFDGVFMERIAGSMLPSDQKLKMTEENLFEPCDTIDTKFKRECWRNQVSVWYSFFKGDTAKVGSYCAAIVKEYWPICFESIGLINVQNLGEDFEKLLVSCQIVNETAYDYCAIGEVKELLFEGKNPKIAFNICFSVTSANRQNCLETYGKMYEQNLQRFR